MQERAKLGCKTCLASNLWEFRGCPIRASDSLRQVSKIAPLVSDFNRCPVDGAFQCQDTYLEILLSLDSNAFPYPGGTLDQPYAFIEAFNLVKGLKNAATAERIERSRKK